MDQECKYCGTRYTYTHFCWHVSDSDCDCLKCQRKNIKPLLIKKENKMNITEDNQRKDKAKKLIDLMDKLVYSKSWTLYDLNTIINLCQGLPKIDSYEIIKNNNDERFYVYFK